MEVVLTVAELRRARARLAEPVGVVPTMGYLHAGHLSLARAARAENASVLATIFVNPTQFGPNEDLRTYPRDLERDLALLEAESTDLVFAPPVEEVYPAAFDTYVEPGQVAAVLEGARRPGHFRGVATVVAKLFNLTRPTRAYFGQKDAQQVAVIRRMVADLDFDLELRVQPTVREPDGLALSSRNVYLTADERAAAPVLAAALFAARERWTAGERDAEALRRLVREQVGAQSLVALEYVSLADAGTLGELDVVDRPALLSLAARLGRTRLIDNVLLG